MQNCSTYQPPPRPETRNPTTRNPETRTRKLKIQKSESYLKFLVGVVDAELLEVPATPQTQNQKPDTPKPQMRKSPGVSRSEKANVSWRFSHARNQKPVIRQPEAQKHESFLKFLVGVVDAEVLEVPANPETPATCGVTSGPP